MPITTGSTIRPAPCADAIRKDHSVSSRNPTCIPTHLKWRCCTSRYMPSETSAAATTHFKVSSGSTMRIMLASASTTPIAAACPSAMGASDRTTARQLFSCMPSATANSQPIPGLRP